jgi:hypothetical protein
MNNNNVKCYKCGQPFLVVGRSKEHIIPDAIGGKGMTSYDLLCQKCNNEWGSRVDLALVDQIGWIADMIGAVRNRPNETKQIEVSSDNGEVTWIHAQGRKGWEIQIFLPTGEPIVLRGKTKDEVIKRAKKKQKELAKKYPNFAEMDIDKETNWTDAWNETIYFGNHVENGKRSYKVGGEEFFRAVTKILVSFSIANGISTDEIKIPFSFLTLGKFENYFLQPFYVESLRQSKFDEDQISHVLCLRGNDTDHLLYAYIELFNNYCFIALLNSNYKGSEIDISMRTNLITGEKSNLKINIDLSADQLLSIPYWPSLALWANGNDLKFKTRSESLRSKMQKLQIGRESRGEAEFH